MYKGYEATYPHPIPVQPHDHAPRIPTNNLHSDHHNAMTTKNPSDDRDDAAPPDYLPPDAATPEDPDARAASGLRGAFAWARDVVSEHLGSGHPVESALEGITEDIDTVVRLRSSLTPEALDGLIDEHGFVCKHGETWSALVDLQEARLRLLLRLGDGAPEWLRRPIPVPSDARVIRAYSRSAPAWGVRDAIDLHFLEAVGRELYRDGNSAVVRAARREWRWRETVQRYERLPDDADALNEALEAEGYRCAWYWAEEAMQARRIGEASEAYDYFNWIHDKWACDVYTEEYLEIEPAPSEGSDESLAGPGVPEPEE